MMSPLEQFAVIPYLKITLLIAHVESLTILWIRFYDIENFPVIYNYFALDRILDLSVTNLNALLVLVIATLLFFLAGNSKIVPFFWQNFLEICQKIIYLLIIENIALSHLHYFPLLFTLFLILLRCNLIGMIPYVFTITSHIIVTLVFSSFFFIGLNLIAIRFHGLQFFTLFISEGLPSLIKPFLVTIEFSSYCTRLFSLGIRLFANMMAGHTLLKILGNYLWMSFSLISNVSWFLIIMIIPFLIIRIITFLEFSITILQAYVFSIPLCIYLNDILILKHQFDENDTISLQNARIFISHHFLGSFDSTCLHTDSPGVFR